MKPKEMREFYSNVAQAIADLGLAIDHCEKANEAKAYRKGIKLVAGESQWAVECAANACDMVHLLHGQLERAAATVKAKMAESICKDSRPKRS